MNSAVTQVLLEAAGRALVAALVMWLAMRLLRVANAPVQKTAWTIVLCAAVAMPLIVRWQWHPSWAAVQLPTTSWLKWIPGHAHASNSAITAPVAATPEPQTAGKPSPAVDTRVVMPDWTYSNPDELARAMPDDTALSTKASTPQSILPQLSRPQSKSLPAQLVSFAWLLYLAVGAALLIRLLFGLASSIRLWIQSRPAETSATLDVPAGVEVRWSAKIASPVNIGSGILLPADYAQWEEEKLRVVLAHESAHVRQRDFYLQLLAGLYAAVIWFSPLGWWLKRKLSELGEAISDHAGLEAAASPLAYAELLLEFAARPRPTYAGVAMAHSTNLHQRIERLLNESSFRRVFAGGRRSAAALLLPAMLIAATALVHVQAAAIPSQTSAPQTAPPQSPVAPAVEPAQTPRTGQSHPDSDQVTDDGSGQAPQVAIPQSAPHPTPAPSASPSPEAAPVPSASPAPIAHVHVAPHVVVTIPRMPNLAIIDPIQIDVPPKGFAFDDDGHRDAYQIIGDPAKKSHFRGRISPDCLSASQKATAANSGRSLLVCHDGKPYIIDDPAIIAQIDAMDKTLQDQAEQMKEASRQLRDAGQQIRVETRQASETAANIPTPDLSKEMAALNASVASLAAKQGATISREQLQEIQREVSAVQRRVIDAEVKAVVNIDMSKFNDEQAKFNEQMSRMGADMGRIARQNDEKIRSMIEESLKNGKAKPVQ
jgi:beta-lactamase regulating signal transducer with metallopeptidase domain